MLNEDMPSVMIGKFIDEDIHTVYLLKGTTYILLVQFSMNEKKQVIEKLKDEYPLIAKKLQNYQGGKL